MLRYFAKVFFGFNFRFFTRKNFYYLRKLHLQFSKSNISYFRLILPLMLSFAASFLEGISLALLIPTLNGLVNKDFGVIKANAYFLKVSKIEFFSFLNNNTSLIVILFILIFAATLAKNIFFLLSELKTIKFARRLTNFLRKSIYARYLSFGRIYFEKKSFGNLHKVLTNYVDNIAIEFRRLQNSIYAICTLFVYLMMMLFISWKLTLMVILIFPILHKSSTKIITNIKIASIKSRDHSKVLSTTISNYLNCISIIKAYGSEKKEIIEFNKTSDAVRDLQYNVDKNFAKINPLQEIIILLFIFILMALISYFASTDHGSSATKYGVFILILRKSSYLFGVLNTVRSSIASLSEPLQGIMSIFDDEDKHIMIDGAKEFPGLKELIEIRNLNFSYSTGAKILQGISFKIVKGTTTAIIGQSGSGKSTIVNLLTRFYEIDSECIFADQIDINQYQIKSWLKQIALVTQETFLLNASLRANLLYGLENTISEEELNLSITKARLDELLKKLPCGLETLIGERGSSLSGGERQRISIARAILKKPNILILDEPTSALDADTEKYIQETLKEVFAGKTLIIIAHRLATIKNADNIIVLEKGIIVEQGPPAQLLSQMGKFQGYWDAQSFKGVISQL